MLSEAVVDWKKKMAIIETNLMLTAVLKNLFLTTRDNYWHNLKKKKKTILCLNRNIKFAAT